jgi:hypothetical protein
MKEIPLKAIAEVGAYNEIPVGYMDLVDSVDQVYRLQFPSQSIPALIAALSASGAQIAKNTGGANPADAASETVKQVREYQFGCDVQAQVAVMRVKFADETVQPIQFGRQELSQTIEQLQNLQNILNSPPAAAR